ncbi:DnaJ domain-containing protein [Hysterangium stoloniferum]|nr:DnaJ domain-containing protein [Hysterangium stoloniferum]
MGAQESKAPPGEQNENDTTVQDYYAILEITETADQDEIKKAFRRQALIHHPDKNAGDVEAATKRFAAIQQAYEVLSDEQERAWYDSHRASLIPEADASTVLEEVRTGKKNSRARDRGLTVRHLMKFFDASNWSGFDDSDKGFFALYRNLFLRLADEETMWDSDVPYSSFGHPNWPWTAPKGQEQVARNFYNQWLSFSTVKDFTWAEQYNLSEAPDRRVRRLIEKENKKARDDAKREYNDTIRSLVLFIRRRDPRYKLHISRNAVSTPTTGVTVESSIEAARRREEAGQAYVEQSWQRIKVEDIDNSAEWEEAEGGEEWECVACSRTFRSEAAWESHERSRKHLKEVDRLRREMQEENEELNDIHDQDAISDEAIIHDEYASSMKLEVTQESGSPDQDAISDEAIIHDEYGSGMKLEVAQESGSPNHAQDEFPDSSGFDILPQSKGKKKGKTKVTVLDAAADEDPGVRSLERGQSMLATPGDPTDREKALESVRDPLTVSNHDQQQMSKRDKRRARDLAKKAQGATTHACNVCHSPFDSKTKLFNHIRDTGHALAARDEDNDYPAKGQKGRKAKR